MNFLKKDNELLIGLFASEVKGVVVWMYSR